MRASDGGVRPAPPVADSSRPALLGERGFFSSLRVLGQARRTFLVCEGQQGVLIIDQHAADERVRFDRLRRAYAAREVRTQRLLFPERVECTELTAASWSKQQPEELLRAGARVQSRLGPTHAWPSPAVPALLSRARRPQRLLHDILAELTRSGERAFADRMDMALATMACHALGDPRAGDVVVARNLEDRAAAISWTQVQDLSASPPTKAVLSCAPCPSLNSNSDSGR